MAVTVLRGNVVLVDLNPVQGSEQAGVRPALVLQTDRANATSPNTIIAAFTSKIRASLLPSHIFVAVGEGGLRLDSILLCEQVRVIDKQRIQSVWGHLSDERMAEVADGLRAALDI